MADVPIAEAKNTLPKLVHEAETGARITLTRRGKPVAVLIGHAELALLQARRERFSDAYADLRRRFDLEALEIDPDEVFTRAEDQSGGRRVTWE